MKILFLSRWFPYPINNGSKLRIYHLLRGLAQQHDVTLLSFADQPHVNPDSPEIRALCSDVHVIPWREFDPHSLRAHFGFLSLMPRSVVDTFSVEMAQKIEKLLRKRTYDLVIASQLSMAAYRPYFRNIPGLFEEVEIGLSYGETRQSSGLKKRIRRTFTWFKLRNYLSSLLDSFQACSVVSEEERGLLARNLSGLKSTVEVIPNCVHVNGYQNNRAVLVPNRLIFAGSFRYQANYEAMLWFVREVYPQILRQVPRAHLIITGDHAGLSFPSAPNVTLVGYVDDIKTLVASAWVSVAPLLRGGGTRLKILEAMAIGTPVVSTSKGAEGLGATNGEHLFVADTPHHFAECVIEILRNKALRDNTATNAYQFVKEKYNWETMIPRFLQLVENTAAKR
jgi:glycosyltransferase involved in cell wall biosynthesis